MKLERLNYNDLYTIAENMREWDRREIFATRWSDDPSELARDTMAVSYEFGWIASRDNRPIAAVGAVPLHTGVWSVWMYATNEFPRVGLGLSRFVVRCMKPALQGMAHRAECRSMDGHEDAQKWLEFIGFKRESSIPKYGRGGETFHLYSIVQ